MHEDVICFSEKISGIPFNLQMCGHSYCDGTYMINRPNSEIYCIEYIIKGYGYVQINNKKFIASQGDVYILPARANHIYYSDTSDPWEKVWFNISGDFIENTLRSYKLEEVYLVKGVNVREYFEDFIKNASKIKQERMEERDFGQCAIDFLKIVQMLYQHTNKEKLLTSKNNAQLLKNKIDTIIDYTLTFEDIIGEIYCTKSHLIRQFRSEYGITPYSYFLNKKINTAKTFLLNTTMSINQISDYLGMYDAHHFSNFFKSRTGISPKLFRKENTFKQLDCSPQ